MQIKENIDTRGRITIRSHPAGSIAIFEGLIKAGKVDRYRELLSMGKIESVQDNMVMEGANTGKDLLVQWLIGTATYPIGINYIAIGTGSTAAAATDTQLSAETARSLISFSSKVGFNVASLQAFITDTNLANGTYREVGGFVNGTGSANSGQLFNRTILSSPYVKASGTDTTIEIDITFT